MEVYRAVDPQGRTWRVEITRTGGDFRATVFFSLGRTTQGSGQRLAGVDALGRWLVEHGMSEADLQPW